MHNTNRWILSVGFITLFFNISVFVASINNGNWKAIRYIGIQEYK